MRIKICCYVLLALVAAGVVGTLTFCFYKINKESRIRQAKYLTAESNRLMADGDVALAQLLLLEALPEHLEETEVALRQSLDMNTIVLQESKTAVDIKISPDDKYVMGFIYSPSKCLCIWKTNNGELIDRIPLEDNTSVDFGGMGTILIVNKGLNIYDIRKKMVVRKISAPFFENFYEVNVNHTGEYGVIVPHKEDALYVYCFAKNSYYKLPLDGNDVHFGEFLNDSVFTCSTEDNLYCFNLNNKRFRSHSLENSRHYSIWSEEYVMSMPDENNIVSVATFGDEQSIHYYEDYTYEKNLKQISRSGRYFATVDSFDDIVIYDLRSHEVYKRIERGPRSLDYQKNDVSLLCFYKDDDHLLLFDSKKVEEYWLKLEKGPRLDVTSYPYWPTHIEFAETQRLAFMRCEYSRGSCYYSFDLFTGDIKMSSEPIQKAPDGSFNLYRNESDNSVKIENLMEETLNPQPHVVANIECAEHYDFAIFPDAKLLMFVADSDYYSIKGDKLFKNKKLSGYYVGCCTDPDFLLTYKNSHLHVWNPHSGKLLKKIPLPKLGEDKEIFGTDVYYDVLKEQWIMVYSYSYNGDDEIITCGVKCQFDTNHLTLNLVEEKHDNGGWYDYSLLPKASANRKWSAEYAGVNELVITDGQDKTYYDVICLYGYTLYNSFRDFVFSPSGGKLLVQRCGINVFDVKTCQPICDLYNLRDGMNYIDAITFSCDEKSIYYLEVGMEQCQLMKVDFDTVDKIRKKVEERLDGRKLTDNERKKYNLKK